MPSREVSTKDTGLTAVMKTSFKHGYTHQVCPSAARQTPVALETSFSPSMVPFVSQQNLGDSNRYGKILWGSVSEKFQAILVQW